MSELPSVDVVIPVLNGFPEIRDCIEGILDQSVQVRRIIVLDSGSTDQTLDYLRGIERVTIVPVAPGTFNHGLTRNLGWMHAGADLLFYTVQDARVLHREVLADMMKPFRDPAVAGVCGQQIVCHDPRYNPVEWFRPVSEPRMQVFQISDAATFDALPPNRKREMCGWDNVAAMYRRSALMSVPFRDLVFGEDLAWCVDALRSGMMIVYQPSARVCHYHLEDPAFTLRRALSSMFVRYRTIGYVHTAPDHSMLMLARVLRLCLTANELSVRRRWYWLRYNLKRRKALRQAHALFSEALSRGEAGLNELFRAYIQKPHRPLKNG
jgi:GT2 family glycosyltransferase